MTLRNALIWIVAFWLQSAVAEEVPPPLVQVSNTAPASRTETTEAPESAAYEELSPIELGAPEVSATPIDLTVDHDDVWDRIRHGFSMPNLDNDLVRRHQIWYMNRPEYLQRVIERSRPYMHYIIEEIEKRGMPTELALLPIVESSYNPMAMSTARASGLWQFIPSTGKNYKLDQTWWVDERRDIVASTGAALDYLKYIYELHGDWQLALASYNWGEGAVGRAIAKNRAKGLPTDYSSLKMPKETQNYVPKLQALKNIVGNPGLWTLLNIQGIPNKPYFSTIPKPADMDVRVAAKLAEMPVNEFVALNPAHNRPVIKADIPLVLPADKVDTFMSNLDGYDDPLSSWQSYTLQKNDKLDKVAARFGISVSQLKTVNGLNGRKARTRPGQTLLVPTRGSNAMIELSEFRPPVVPEPVVKKKKRTKPTNKKTKTGVTQKSSAVASKSSSAGKRQAALPSKRTTVTRYTVKSGDTLSSIARKFNIEVRDISKRNRVKAGIKPGQQLLIAPG